MDVDYILRIILRARDELGAGFASARAEVTSFSNSVRKSAGDTEKLNKQLSGLNTRLNTIKGKVNETGNALKQLASGAHEDFQQLDVDAQKLTRSVTDGSKAARAAVKENKNLGESIARLEEAERRVTEGRKTGTTTTREYANELKRIGNEYQVLSKKMDIGSEESRAFERMAQQRIQLSNNIMQAERDRIKQTASLESALERRRIQEDRDRTRRAEQTARNVARSAEQETTAKRRALDKQLSDAKRTETELTALRKRMSGTQQGYTSFLGGSGDMSRQEQITFLKNYANEFGKLSRQFDVNSREAGKMSRAEADARTRLEELGGGARRAGSSLRNLENDEKRASGGVRGLVGWLDRQAQSMANNTESVARFDNKLRGLIVLAVVAFAQQLITIVGALGGELISVGSSAIFAGGALAGAFVTGVAQALPVIGLLGSALLRVKNVMTAVKQQNLEQKQQFAQGQKVDKRMADSSDAIANAQDTLRSSLEAVTQAHRRVQDATIGVTKAREDARRQLQDLIQSERDADAAARGSILSQEEAQRALQAAVASGDTSAVAEAQLRVTEAGNQRIASRTTRGRARVDAGTARRAGIEGSDQVIQAKQQLEDARKGLVDSERAAERARRGIDSAARQAQVAGADSLAAVGNLNFMLSQLDPAEKRLYNSMIAFRKVWNSTWKGVTDPVINAFTRAVDEGTKLMQDPRVLRAARGLATGVAGQMDRVRKAFTTGTAFHQLITLIHDAEQNLRPITDIAVNVGKALLNIAVDAAPAFHTLLNFIDGLVKQFLGLTNQHGRVQNFFSIAERHLQSWIDLSVAIVRFFMALSGQSQQQGLQSVQELTGWFNKLTTEVDNSGGSIHKFLADSHAVIKEVLSVLGALGKEMLASFNPGNVEHLGNLLRTTVIPALGLAIRGVGLFTSVMAQFLSLPGVSTLGKYAIALALVGKAASGVTALIEGGLLGIFGRVNAEGVRVGGLIGRFQALIKFMSPLGVALLVVSAVILAVHNHLVSLHDILTKILPIVAAITIALVGPGKLLAGFKGLFTVFEGFQAASIAGKFALIRDAIGGVLKNVVTLITRLPILNKLFKTTAGAEAAEAEAGAAGGVGGRRGPVGKTGPLGGLLDKRGSTPANPLFVEVVNQVPGGGPVPVGRGGAAAEEATAVEAGAAGGLLGKLRGFGSGVLGRAPTAIFGGIIAQMLGSAIGGGAGKTVGGLGTDAAIGFGLGGPAGAGVGVGIGVITKELHALKAETAGLNLDSFAKPLDALKKQITSGDWAGANKAIDVLHRMTFETSPENAAKVQGYLDKVRSKILPFINAAKELGKQNFRIKANDIVDPNAAAQLASGWDYINKTGVLSVTDLRERIAYNNKLITAAFKDGSKASTDAMLKNLGEGITGAKELLRNHVITHKQYLAQIRSQTDTQYNAVKEQMINATAAGDKGAVLNLTSAASGMIAQLRRAGGGTEKEIKHIRDLMIKGLQFYGFTHEQAINIAKTGDLAGRAPHAPGDPSRGQAGGGFAGGFEGMEGERGGDFLPRWLGRGEAVLNWAHQKALRPVLSWAKQAGVSSYGTLGELFRKVRGKHGLERGAGFAGGGFVAEPGTNFSVGDEPAIAAALRRLARLLGTTIYGISGYRTPQHSVDVGGFADDPHTRGQAADIGVGSALLSSASRLTASLLARVGLYRPFYPADPHEINHVQLLGGGGRGVVNAVAAAVTQQIQKITNPRVGGAGPSMLRSFEQMTLNRLVAGANTVLSRNAPGSGGAGGVDFSAFHGGGNATANMALGRRMATAMGWVGRQWQALRQLWIGESGWDDKIVNKSSGAGGIPQALPASKMGAGWFGNAKKQIAWGLNYIKGRYGDPASALSAWLSRSPHWYEAGGPVSGYGPQPAVLHGDEHVWTAGEVMRAGGHKVMFALRQLLGGGGQGTDGSYASGGRVLMVGDSLGYGSVSEGGLAKLIHNLTADTKVGRTSEQAIEELRKHLTKAIKQVIFDVGTNDGSAKAFATSLRKAYQLVGKDRSLVVSTVRGPDAAAKNEILRAFAAQHSNVSINEWSKLVASHHLALDPAQHIHPTAAGYQARARALAGVANAATRTTRGGTPAWMVAARKARHDAALDLGLHAPNVSNISSIERAITEVVKKINAVTSKTKYGSERLRKLYTTLDNNETGYFDALANAVSDSGIKLKRYYDKVRYSVKKVGDKFVVTDNDDPVKLANIAATEARQSYVDLLGERGAITKALHAAQRQLKNAKTTVERQNAQSAVNAATKALTDNQDQLNQTLADMMQAQIEQQQAAVDKINASYARQTAGLDIGARIASALGRDDLTAQINQARRDAMAAQANDLEGRIKKAQAAGATDLANELTDQVADLRTTIFESLQADIQTSIDRVNATAQSAQNSLGRRGRINDLLETVGSFTNGVLNIGSDHVTAARNREGLNADAGTALRSQRSGLAAILAAQQALPVNQQNVKIITDLTDQIAELDTQIQENTATQHELTVATRQAALDQLSAQQQFKGGVFSGLTGLVQAIGGVTGSENTTVEASVTQAAIAQLNQTGNALRDQLLSGYGIDLHGASGIDLVNALQTLDYSGIESNMSDTDKQLFEALITQLIENETSLNQNTQQLNTLNGQSSQPQSWTTTAWQWFREALTNGMGDVLPQYQVPMMASGGIAMKAGLYHMEPGEAAVPLEKHMSMKQGDINIEINEAGGPIDMTHLASTVAWAAKTAQG